MEEPVSFEAQELRAEKEKVLSAVRLPKDLAKATARGQYAAGWQGGEQVTGYLQEDGIAKSSTTETYAALKVEIDTRRWAGVPFYLRTGKRLGKRVTEIAVVFKRAPHLPFNHTATEELGQNAIVIRVQPDEGITMRFGSKVPGAAMEVRDVTMDFGYGRSFTESSPEAYERRCSRGTRRSSCPGTSSTRSRRSGPSRAAPSPTPPAAGAPRVPTR
jgi:glucose-6-phosphate 1-dehydrogenase